MHAPIDAPVRRPRRRQPVALALILPSLVAGAACAASPERATPRPTAPASQAAEGGHLARVLESGRLVMVSFPHQESHFVHADLSRGLMPAFGPAEHFAGIDVEIMERFAADLGVELWVRRVSEPSYAQLIPDLLAGQGDLIASSLTITPARREKVDFSRPYYSVHQVVVVREGSDVDSIDDLPERIGAVIPGSSHEERLRGLGVDDEHLLESEFMLENYSAVQDGAAHYAVVDSGSAERVVPKMEGLRVAFRLPGEESYGFAVAPGSDLLPRLNAFLDELDSTGGLAAIMTAHAPEE